MTARGGRAMAAVPALLLLAGLAGRGAVRPDASLPLAVPLEAFPAELGGSSAAGEERLKEGELRILAPDDYLLRTYRTEEGREFSLFIAYYGRQLGGSSIHSPRNCLPGSGWEPVEQTRIAVETPYGPGEVNRTLVEHRSGARALVFYWYQGRGRVAANEYAVKFHLLRDALLRGRTDEALVRLVFPLPRGEDATPAEAGRLVREVSQALAAHLPG